ncbi:hypothetical protein WICPIJ_007881 [Wickerhamomyces pijperi]|uniref:UNC-50 family protein n=1 Tax=Wickerhamomyces pijperi TaxID=599730 RepID=A0A9P8TK19_WICPI|nr:hypothetical protein WICPIJ_007881 [Wickerhamomyces pijperi]
MARQPSHTPILPQTNDDVSSYRSGRTATSFTPTSFFGSRNGSFKPNSTSSSSVSFKMPLLLKRIFKPVGTLDFETAMWEILQLLHSPKKVYKSLYYRNQTKNHWARDDPSFFILLSGLITLSAVAWGVAYSPGVLGVLKLIVYMVFVDFFIVGGIVASVCWFAVNRFLRRKDTISGTAEGGELEWGYCFDVHCNSYLIIWVNLYVVQFILLPVLQLDNWLSLILGNSLYFGSWVYYTVITFYGYNLLPFLVNTQLVLYPIVPLTVVYLISCLFGINLTQKMTEYYFS